jgi:hypothetical protein
MTYAEKLNQTKETYPFTRWREAVEFGLEQYTQENCDRIRKIFDDLIADLIAKGEIASESAKLESFRVAIEATNEMNDEFDGSFIETGEREDLYELTNVITEAVGLNPDNYGEGEGLASEWRDW